MSPNAAAQDPLDYQIGENGVVTFAGTGHVYTIARSSFRRQTVSLADAGGRMLQVDTLDLLSDLARGRFLKSLKELLNGHADAVRRELKLIASLLEVILPEPPGGRSNRSGRNPYDVNDAGVFYERFVPNMPEPITTQLSNFGAKITADIQVNDGHEDRREFELDAWQGATRRTIAVSAERFASLKWAIDSLGANAVVFPGPSSPQHVAAAIQLTSTPEQRLVFGHTGWRQLDDGTMGFLSASGALTGDGLRDDITVQLPPPLDAYHLPEPPADAERVTATRALLGLLELAHPSVTVPLLCAFLRSVLMPADFVLFLKGSTGQGKTQLAGLVQSCFGKTLGPENLPSNFSSTGNAIEMTANLAKDCILVVDDFQRNSAVNADAIAERIGRAVGNHAGRARLTREAQLRSSRPPRGTVIMTGEDIPKGESLRARMSIVELPRNAMRWDRLTEAQQAAKAGVYATAAAGFVAWLAGDHAERMREFTARFEVVRQEFHAEHASHPKTTNTAAHLMAAFTLFLDYLESLNAWSEAELDALKEQVEAELRALITAQAAHLVAADPVMQFLHGLESAITAGRAHLANASGEAPANAISWGWMKVQTSDSFDWRAKGQKVGWVASDEGVYLDFGAAFQVVQQGAVSIGNALPLNETTLLKRIHERGYLLARDEARGTLKVRRQLEGRNYNVVHLNYPLEDEA